jgi:Protein of unknown function (DUF1064)
MERMTSKQLRAQRTASPTKDRRRVQGTRRVFLDGVWFDSQREATRWAELKLLERAGQITTLRRQVNIPLVGQAGPILTDKQTKQRDYIADFVYFDCALGVEVIEDAKGYATDIYLLKREILRAMGIEIREV